MTIGNLAARRAALAISISLLFTACTTGSGGSGSSASGSGGTGGAGGSGGAGGCTTAADCPGADTDCLTRTCDAGTCGVDFAPMGSLAGTQTSGDCKAVVCNGIGLIITVADDSDVPSDSNACTQDICTNGAPSHVPLPAGSACGSGGQLACDGNGACVGCGADPDCGPPTACSLPMCDLGTGLCSPNYVPSGQGDPGGQTSGDCKKLVCNGSGGTLSINDDNDAPDDGNPCTADACAGGVASHTLLPSGTSCGGGVCDNGICAYGCFVNGQLYPPQSYYLDSQICLSCDPSVSTSSLYTGSCHFNLQAGTCSGGGVCNMLYTECATGCSDCTVKPCGSGYCYGLPMPAGTPCVDDGDPCTTDQCNAMGGCIHVDVTNGTSCGMGLVCVSGGCIDESTWDCGSGYTCQPIEHCCSGAAGNHGCRDMQTACP